MARQLLSGIHSCHCQGLTESVGERVLSYPGARKKIRILNGVLDV